MKFCRTKYKVFTRLLICLVVGLIASVGVAWIGAATSDYSDNLDSAKIYRTAQSAPCWIYRKVELMYGIVVVSHGNINNSYQDSKSVKIQGGPAWSRVSLEPDFNSGVAATPYLEEASGWPLVCMVSVSSAYWPNHSDVVHGVVSGVPLGKNRQGTYGRPMLLPIKPIWRGLLVNTALYATFIWFVIVVLIRLRNSILRKCGLCIHCRYKVRDLLVCPECGSDFSG